MTEFLYVLFSFLPFMTCLVWFVIYLAEMPSSSRPKRFLTVFALACTMLYFCHAWFFMAEDWEYGLIDALYLLCNLSVYPLFYCYVAILTRDVRTGWRLAVFLAPALILSVLAYLGRGDARVLDAARSVFAAEVVLVTVFGLRSLYAFNRQIRNYYSDTEGKTLKSTSVLLSCFSGTSILSAAANFIGRDFFLHSAWLSIPSLSFTIMLFCIFYISMHIGFWAGDFRKDVSSDDEAAPEPDSNQEDAALEEKISAVMEEQKLYLRPGLKISDVAAAVGSNRTYVSGAINGAAGVSFADYVNSRRIEYAKKRLEELSSEGEYGISEVASEAGFSSFPSFYRAFVKFVGESPSSWLKGLKR